MLKLLDIGGKEDGTIQTIAGKGGSPTRSNLSLHLRDMKQSGIYQCSPSNTVSDEVQVHIVQGKFWALYLLHVILWNHKFDKCKPNMNIGCSFP